MADERFNEHLSQMTTRWSLVFQAHQGSKETASAAQRDLLLRYRGAILRYLLGALRDPGAAEEVAQEFALSFLRGDFRQAHPDRGRFRDLVKTVLFHQIVNYHRQRQKDARLQPLPADAAAPEPDLAEADRQFLERWRAELLDRTWEALAAEQAPTGQLLYPVLLFRARHPDLPSAQMAEQLGAELGKPLTAAGVRQTLHRARERFADLLLEEVTRSLQTSEPERVAQEVSELGLLPYCRPALQRRARRHESQARGKAAP
jgi:DNA-directed RNA polymerase specialized sigma24 family protein